MLFFQPFTSSGEEIMPLSELLLAEFDDEMAKTRKLLACLPDEITNWKPHPKSMEMNRLAGHIAELPTWGTHTMKLEQLDITPAPGKNFEALFATSREKLLEVFDKNVAEAHQAISGASDEHLAKTWTLIFKGKPVMQMPRRGVLRGMVMNHLIHHRAQLGVYLRLNNISIPGMYGASADEPSMFRD